MAASQQPIPGRPTPGQGAPLTGPPQTNMVLQHQQPQLVPMAGTSHFPQVATFPHQIPLQHQRPLMNGIGPGHPQFQQLHPSQQAALAAAEQQRRQAQMRLHQGAGLPPGATAGQLGQLGPYQQQMAGPGGMHPQQLQQLQQQFQQQNPGMRIPPQQVLQGQHLIPPQAMPGPGMQHVQVQQAGQPVVNGR